ncbi:hypothetical protein D3C74_91620 [compost metagenome]
MSANAKIAHKYNALFANNETMIYVHYEDIDGYVHYIYYDDPTKQIYTMTKTQLLNNFERSWHSEKMPHETH